MPETSKVECPECGTETELIDRAGRCPKCRLNVGAVFERDRHEQALERLRAKRTAPAPAPAKTASNNNDDDPFHFRD